MPKLVLSLLIVFFPSTAYAYVDPGFLGALYQLIYVFIFGALATWVMKPVRFFKSTFAKVKGWFKPKENE